jgi:hypothetical protein
MSAANDLYPAPEMGGRDAETLSEGYCLACHDLKPADQRGSCRTCGNALINVHERVVPRGAGEAAAPERLSPEVTGGSAPTAAAGPSVATPQAGGLPAPEPSLSQAPPAQGATGCTVTKLSPGIVTSWLQRLGTGLLTLATVGVVVLWLVQQMEAESWFRGWAAFGDRVFVAIRGTEARVLGLVLLVLVIATLIPMTGLALLPRAGRGLRISSTGLIVVGAGCILAGLWLEPGDHGRLWLAPLLGGLAVLLAGLFVMLKALPRARLFRETCKTRLGTVQLFRKRGLGIRLAVIVALWVVALAWYLIAVLTTDPGWTIQVGGYVGAGLLGLGLLGALAMLSRIRRPTVWIDREGNIVESVAPRGAPAGS